MLHFEKDEIECLLELFVDEPFDNGENESQSSRASYSDPEIPDQEHVIPSLNGRKKRSLNIKTISKKKKPKKMNAKLVMQKLNSCWTLASKYMNYYLACRNGDGTKFDEFVQTVCKKDCVVDLHVTNNKNYFGNFSFLKQVSIQDWVESVKNIQKLSPDSFMKLIALNAIFDNTRSIPPDSCQCPSSTPAISTIPLDAFPLSLVQNGEDETAFIAHLNYTGTLITKDSSFMKCDQEQGKILSFENVDEKLSQSKLNSFISFQEFQIQGCLIFHRKNHERIHKVEFFYEFTK